MLLLWSQVKAELLQALHCLPEDVFDHTPGHPHNLSGSSHQRTVDCGLTPISHCCVHVNGVPDCIQVRIYYTGWVHPHMYITYITWDPTTYTTWGHTTYTTWGHIKQASLSFLPSHIHKHLLYTLKYVMLHCTALMSVMMCCIVLHQCQ